ncbi:recombinase family protein [Cereibacter sphaeroides]|uniref:recombinase family protein n=1 Tax=Cereibacter sphaeroides TaxID=1063 RepID=UPI001F235D27|nr:recombinase family protein [Cereibacter sphaeroides]MCE6959121.1 recombinase family protein [Cereibacter sphaeroides]MCE6968362.1 recombinase family protein [Cereibacter sphaeroides]MCE6974218.1 recombinase family protein [Cereibacter sphaeroides]
MIIGYARTSTLDQTAGLEAQERDLQAAGCERIFVEQVSSVDMVARAKLAEALEFVRQGDTLVVTKLDRLARSVAHLMEILAKLDTKGASLRILGMGIDTATPTGKLMLTILGGVAEFERAIMLERQREGIAKAEGKYKGRKPTARAQADQVQRLKAEGLGASEIAEKLGIGRASVYRILAD